MKSQNVWVYVVCFLEFECKTILIFFILPRVLCQNLLFLEMKGGRRIEEYSLPLWGLDLSTGPSSNLSRKRPPLLKSHRNRYSVSRISPCLLLLTSCTVIFADNTPSSPPLVQPYDTKKMLTKQEEN